MIHRKILIAFQTALLFSTQALLAPPSMAAQAKAPTCASVAGTQWNGFDSDGDDYEFEFLPSGNLHYKSPTGYWKNGKWTQKGCAIYFQMNNKYSEYTGHISGIRMEGTAGNIKGHRWGWKVRKVDFSSQGKSI